ncbi:MmgE/PrpD family protein [compost metagenome]
MLEAPFGGFFDAVSEDWVPGHLTAGLGHAWEILKVGFKPYATAGASHASLLALDEIMLEGRLTAADIAAIDVRCTTYCFKHVAWPYEPRGVAAAQLNLFFALAAMAVDRAALIAQFAEDRLADPRLLAFMPKIHVQPDPELDALGHAHRYAMIMTVRTMDGRTFRRESRDRPGSPGRALTRQQLVDKFRLLAASVLPDETIEQVISTVSALDRLETTAALSDLLVPA